MTGDEWKPKDRETADRLQQTDLCTALTDTIKNIMLPRPSHAAHTLVCQTCPDSFAWQNSITTYHQ